ncbi:MAG: RidA family protein [Deltaproteobacteria bacterium]|nr:RidA family protein [Deltaproteobacteria bacterium]
MRHPAFAAFLLLLLGSAGCGPNREDLQQLVRDEMSRAAEKAIISPVPVIGPYSPAVRVGNFLFVSGQIALDPETGTMKNENIEVETRQVLDNMRRILRAAGFDSSHVISATVYLKDIGDYGKMNTIYGGYFQEGAYPARVAVQVAALPKQANVEISVIAHKP